MKIIHPILTALIASSGFAAEPAQPLIASDSKIISQSGSKIQGKATVIIEVNGKKEVREIDLGNATEVKIDGTQVVITSPDSSAVSSNVKSNEPKKPWLGVLLSEGLSEEVRAQLPPLPDGVGLLVQSVIPESPADKAGLLKFDVLTKLDDQLLIQPPQFRTLVANKKEGDTVRLTVLRRGHEEVITATLALRVGGDGVAPKSPLGVILKNLEPLAAQSGAIVLNKGLQILDAGHADIAGKLRELEKTLRELGVDNKALEQAKKALQQAEEAARQRAEARK